MVTSYKPTPKLSNTTVNKVQLNDQPVHDWYRFVLSYPPHLVSNYLRKFGIVPGQVVLDPFCGTGTTLVESKLRGIASVGVEALPMAHFASEVKTDWSVDAKALQEHAAHIASLANKQLASDGIPDDSFFKTSSQQIGRLLTLSQEQNNLLLSESISPIPLHKTLTLLQVLNSKKDHRFHRHELLALAKALVGQISNLRFGPEVGIGQIKEDALVVGAWLREVNRIAADLKSLSSGQQAYAHVYLADARAVGAHLEPSSIDAVITSPPYPNEKDYTRTTRLESVLLGFIKTKQDLQNLKRTLVRSNTRTVYKGDEDDTWVSDHPEIQRLASSIENRRIELGKTSGFERLYSKVTKLYFGGMLRHLGDLRKALKPGANLAYVLGDQASYFRVMIRTGQLIADIAKSLGYEVVDIDLFRTRLATATREQLREEVVILRWPGKSRFVSMTPGQSVSEPTVTYGRSSSKEMNMKQKNRYTQIIEKIFFAHFKKGMKRIPFSREEFIQNAKALKIDLPRNLGDIVYSFRYRTPLPESIQACAPKGLEWVIRPIGIARYAFEATTSSVISPSAMMAETKIPDATPGVITQYALNDEQALLAKLRYNRLIDIFTRITCYSLQSHLRTTVPNMGQVETDEIYVGIDRQGVHYVLPVQAKGRKDKLGTVQIEQDIALCSEKFPHLVCRPIAALFMPNEVIAMFEFETTRKGLAISSERHYRLVSPEEMTPEDLEKYRKRVSE
jgi:hypothetical protein